MHAVVFTVDIEPTASKGQLDAELDELIGFVKIIPGFVRGTWTNDGTTGLSFQLYENETVARNVVANAALPPDAGVTFRSADVYEVARDV